MTADTAPRFRSDILVEPIPDGCCGSDRLIAHAAWAEHPDKLSAGRDDTPQGWGRVIRGMMRHRHTSPFEKGRMEVYVEAPGVVWWQWTRHRFMGLDTEDFAFNLESGRYKVLDGVFYVPTADRPMIEPAGFNPLRPALVAADPAQAEEVADLFRRACGRAWETYDRGLVSGQVSREVARMVLPNWSLYCSGYVGAGPLTWLQFFSKRRKGGEVATFPQHEIEVAAARCERLFAERWPITYEAFVSNGRVAL